LKIAPRVSELADPEIWHFPLTLLVVLTTLSHYRVRCDIRRSPLSATIHYECHRTTCVGNQTASRHYETWLSWSRHTNLPVPVQYCTIIRNWIAPTGNWWWWRWTTSSLRWLAATSCTRVTSFNDRNGAFPASGGCTCSERQICHLPSELQCQTPRSGGSLKYTLYSPVDCFIS